MTATEAREITHRTTHKIEYSRLESIYARISEEAVKGRSVSHFTDESFTSFIIQVLLDDGYILTEEPKSEFTNKRIIVSW